MNRIVLAVLVAAAPAVARAQDRDGWDYGSWADDGQGYDDYGYGDEQYQSDWSQSDDGSWRSYPDESGYAAQRGPSFDDFRGDSSLSWNGEWIDTPEYGTVWRPRRVASDWQPYTYGRWVWTNAGWAWASDEPFGWAVYHYGRWAWSPAAGWMWVPGRVWAPAWVSWRWSDGYAAWCPMGVQTSYVDHPAVWVVVPTRTFLEPIVHHVVPRSRRRVLPLPMPAALRTGPAVALIERATGRAVRPLAIGEARNPSAARTGLGSIMFYRPHTAPVAGPGRRTQPQVSPQGPRVAPPTSGPGRPPRPTSFGAAVQSVQPRPRQPVQAQPQQRPFGQVVPMAAPHRAPPPTAQPAPRPVPGATAQPVPHVAAPVARSGPEQPQVKER